MKMKHLEGLFGIILDSAFAINNIKRKVKNIIFNNKRQLLNLLNQFHDENSQDYKMDELADDDLGCSIFKMYYINRNKTNI
jgi:hypothetical protein